ncbi:hypothetical protein [Zhongshania aliphaticivorans]|uniref:hypothetical protein n=1 Tax=Zhongshania aliphaticivorans TaxID=1470434 RepID=UPI0012E685E6|nr:hypothetical protein [Zhongshania aliphaticivorans]CAA0108302.1 Uncharacterised protein [Zhongshania aliphaticivorans]
MSWLIAVVVIGFMLAPIMWILPSRRQSQQAEIRAFARTLGLSVKVVAMPKTRRAKIRREDDVFGVCYTRFLHNKTPLAAWKYWLIAVPDGDDDITPIDPVMLELIESQRQMLPKDASMLELTPLGLNIYWRENHATTDVVKNIAQCFDIIIEEGRLENGVNTSDD